MAVLTLRGFTHTLILLSLELPSRHFHLPMSLIIPRLEGLGLLGAELLQCSPQKTLP